MRRQKYVLPNESKCNQPKHTHIQAHCQMCLCVGTSMCRLSSRQAPSMLPVRVSKADRRWGESERKNRKMSKATWCCDWLKGGQTRRRERLTSSLLRLTYIGNSITKTHTSQSAIPNASQARPLSELNVFHSVAKKKKGRGGGTKAETLTGMLPIHFHIGCRRHTCAHNTPAPLYPVHRSD